MGVNYDPSWVFVIDLSEYAGNHERHLCEYVTGRSDVSYSQEDEEYFYYIDLFIKETPEGHFKKDLFGYGIDDPGDDGLRRSPVTIVPTPGFENLGDGTVVPLKPGKEPKYGAYNSVGLFLNRKPTKEELKKLTERANKFEAVPPQYAWDSRPKIVACRLVLLKTILETHWSSKN